MWDWIFSSRSRYVFYHHDDMEENYCHYHHFHDSEERTTLPTLEICFSSDLD
ncbi:hypothetical protein A2U01_0072709, partial [Trifolium medium]|nr:hypothetical protein [Trifolium medium]